MRILLVEPDPVLAEIYRRALETANHKVFIAATAQEAVFAADDHQPNLILLELQLAGHSGIEFLYEFRTYPEWMHVPVIILSNVPANELHNCGHALRRQLGVTGYHYKPQLRLADLLRIVEV